jgi:HlyD family secretion protein
MKALILAMGTLIALTACAPEDNANRVVGELASDRIELTAEFNEPIIEIAVAEGESVTAGRVLLRQDDARAIARLAEAESAVLQASARLDELVRGPRTELIVAARANVEGATQALEFRRSEQTRFEEIHRRGLASAEGLDRANAALDAAQADLKLQLARLEELLAGTTLEELTQAEQASKQAAARRDRAQIDFDRHAIVAPTDGVVDSRLFEIGERPGIGQPVIVMLGSSQPYARVYVPEQLRVRIRPGTQASIYVDGLITPIAGKVRWVASEAAFTPYFALTERDRGRLSYVAKVDIVDERDRLPDGLPVEVEFEFEIDFVLD